MMDAVVDASVYDIQTPNTESNVPLPTVTSSRLHCVVLIVWSTALSVCAEDAPAGSESRDLTPAGHSAHGEAFNEGPRQKAYLMGTTGAVDFAVSTVNAEARKFFNQGVGQLHGFWYFEAERSFRQVAAIDPECAMAYWGMAMAN